MRENSCVKKECRFYTEYSECAINGCMYGASIEDKEEEKGCYMNDVQTRIDTTILLGKNALTN